MKNPTKKLNAWQKTLIIVGSVILGLGILLGGAIGYFRLSVKAYYDASSKAFLIPDIHKGAVPQGFHYDEATGNFLVSAYMKDDSASPLFIVQKNTGKTLKRVTLATDKNKPYTGHFSGIAMYKDFVYVTDNTSLLVYSYTAILNAKYNAQIPCLGRIATKVSDTDYIKNSFVTVHDGKLIAGEFYDGDMYTTLSSHHITTKAGAKSRAIALGYDLDDTKPFGVNPEPTKAYALPDKAQGLCVNNGKFYVSTSFGAEFSHIFVYETSKFVEQNSMTFLGKDVPVYALDSASLVKDYEIAPMSEEIVIIDNQLYVMCESASTKYIFGNFLGAKWCYKTDLSKMR
jgi:hypothetical protein